MRKPADTELELHALIRERWSPRAFDPVWTLGEPTLTELFEAARWAPSSSNSQPWRFIYGLRGDATFTKIHADLKVGNQRWAGRASALIVAIARAVKPDGKADRAALYDTGQAVAYLTMQAQYRGLSVRQMGGFEPSINAALGLPENFRAAAVIALGMIGSPEGLDDEELRSRETAPRSRRDLAGIVRHGDWGAEFDD